MALVLNTPLADALSNRIQPKLVEIGWSVGGEDSSPLSEYICLMLVNGKSQEQIAAELSGDLLGLDPGDSSATEFSTWLFEQMETLRGQLEPSQGVQPEANGQMDHDMNDTEETEMQDGVPTAPKAMRQPNGRRLMNQISKAMERQPGDALHRVRSQPSERVDKFRREPPKGPARLHHPNQNHQNNHMMDRRHGQFNNNRGMHNNRRQGFQNGGVSASFAHMNPQQQMAFYNMYQQQSQMMAPYMMDGGQANPFMPPGPMGMPPGDAYSNNFAMPQRQNGASLFDRIQAPPDLSSDNGTGMDISDDAKVEETNGNSTDKPEEVPCKFATNCTKADCPYGHPSPAAVGRNTAYVSGEKCPFGATCKNRKCTGSHPSPASAKGAGFVPKPAKIDADCKFFPNCTNPTCPFKHPTMPMCRNGANCTRPDCHFTHTEIACKYNPCLNPNCAYKHEEGQQQQPSASSFENKVWTAAGGTREHVSERKFTAGDEAQEELILPGQTAAAASAPEKEADMDTAPVEDGVE